MRSKIALILAPLGVVALWWLVRGRAEPAAPAELPAGSLATEGAGAARVGSSARLGPASAPDDPAGGRSSPPAKRPAGADSADAAELGRAGSPASNLRARSPWTRPGDGPGSAPRPADDEAPAGKLTDRTGWSDTSVAKQLNKEFMPLASECIAQAQARNPKLDGMLAYAVTIAPTENGKAIVSAVKLSPENQIVDPELFECIRESSFAIEGLTAPHDFAITMPIHPDGRD